MGSKLSWRGAATAGFGAAALLLATAGSAMANSFEFDMVRSGGAGCAPDAKGHVKIVGRGFAEDMTVTVSGVPAGTEMDLFVLQVPGFPFGLGWYVGDLEANAAGKVTKTFRSRFNREVFAVAVGQAGAPTPHGNKDASSNPPFKPIHTFHLGIWFNSPADAKKAGCPQNTTPFNGDHTAGIQFLNTSSFGDKNGPLRKVN